MRCGTWALGFFKALSIYSQGWELLIYTTFQVSTQMSTFITLLGTESVTLPPLPAHSSQQIMSPKIGTWALYRSCIFPKSRMLAPWLSWMDVCYSYPNFLYLLLPAPPANLPLSQPPGLSTLPMPAASASSICGITKMITFVSISVP